jgi:hypothetical protein
MLWRPAHIILLISARRDDRFVRYAYNAVSCAPLQNNALNTHSRDRRRTKIPPKI